MVSPVMTENGKIVRRLLLIIGCKLAKSPFPVNGFCKCFAIKFYWETIKAPLFKILDVFQEFRSSHPSFFWH